MQLELTPAVDRIFASLAASTAAGGEQPLAPRLLLALLAETECRAALALAERSITAEGVLSRWPAVADGVAAESSQQSERNGHAARSAVGATSNGAPSHDASPNETPSEPQLQLVRTDPEILLIMARAKDLLADFPPPAFATEHLLLGLAAREDDLGRYLQDHGLTAETLLAKIRQQLGIETEPLAVNWDDLVAEEVAKHAGAAQAAVHPAAAEPAGADSETPAEDPEAKSSAQSAVPRSIRKPEELDAEIAAYLTEAAPAGPRSSPAVPQVAETGVYRVLDAAANRAAEGLRVLEDAARFVLNDLSLTRELKLLRHDLHVVIARLPQSLLHAARDVSADVGTGLTAPGEAARGTIDDILAANFQRVQQSLRSLEEFSKLVDPRIAAAFKQLRYLCYAAHRTSVLGRDAAQVLAKARLYVLLDGRESLTEFKQLAESLIDVGVPLIQLREKQLNDRELQGRGEALVRLASGTDTRIIINDRPDLAAALGAAGVHLGQEELAPAAARQLIGPQALLGISTHDLVQAHQAVADGASYLGVGPTFPTPTKSFTEFPGLAFARQVAEEIRLPAYAIGGITLANLDEVLATGIHGVAVASGITERDQPASAAREFLRRLT